MSQKHHETTKSIELTLSEIDLIDEALHHMMRNEDGEFVCAQPYDADELARAKDIIKKLG